VSLSWQEALTDHLTHWGLRHVTSDDEYFRWQRDRLSPLQLDELRRAVERKRSGHPSDEAAFYDLTADPQILPILYSQRYEYFSALAPRVASYLHEATRVLDAGCGVGILTTMYARLFPSPEVVGVDRSPASIARAREQAAALGLSNVRFDCLDLTKEPLDGTYDVIVATHALVQAEQDPGLPSLDWRTFARADDADAQRRFEERTGVGVRLDRLCEALAPEGRLLLFEKTRPLARRVPVQRALAARGLAPVTIPEPVRYRTVEELTEDGPFYVLRRGANGDLLWNESPEPDEGPSFDREACRAGAASSEAPLYENHRPSAQRAWEQLHGRVVEQELTRRESDGRQLHVELGRAEGWAYLYCANTFDQRQLVVADQRQLGELKAYYEDIVRSAPEGERQ